MKPSILFENLSSRVGVASRLTMTGLALFYSYSLQAGVIDENLESLLRLDTAEKLTVLIHFKEEYDLSKLPSSFENQAERGREIAKILESHTQENIAKSFPFLRNDSEVEEITPLWIINSVRVKASPATIQKLATWDNRIDSIALDNRQKIEEMEDVGATLFRAFPAWEQKVGWGVEKVRATELWKQGITGKGVLVAVIDSGANIKHPDLAPSIWVNPGETGNVNGVSKETNGIDDDGDGFIDDVNGWNFEDKNGNVMDLQGHGSQTAGLVGGMGAGGTSTGIAPGAKLAIVRTCCNLAKEAGESAIMEGMQYAVKVGAKVISMSLSIKPFGKPMYAKWRRASEVVLAAGVVHVNSAGNLGSGKEPANIGAPASNPPAWFHPKQTRGNKPSSMITIGATDEKDKVRPYSSVGPVTWQNIPEFADFPYEKGVKPGLIRPDVCGPSEVPSTSKDGMSYTKDFGGTSSATPQVAGVTALLLSAHKNLTVAQVTEALQMSAVSVESEFNNKCGAGRVDAVAAVEYAKKNFKAQPE